jgi:hypothetical protein
MEYKITKIQFIHELTKNDIETREVIVTLDNDSQVHITACYESWEQWGATTDEKWCTVPLADRVNEWLHGETDEIPTDVYDYIENEDDVEC